MEKKCDIFTMKVPLKGRGPGTRMDARHAGFEWEGRCLAKRPEDGALLLSAAAAGTERMQPAFVWW